MSEEIVKLDVSVTPECAEKIIECLYQYLLKVNPEKYKYGVKISLPVKVDKDG